MMDGLDGFEFVLLGGALVIGGIIIGGIWIIVIALRQARPRPPEPQTFTTTTKTSHTAVAFSASTNAPRLPTDVVAEVDRLTAGSNPTPGYSSIVVATPDLPPH